MFLLYECKISAIQRKRRLGEEYQTKLKPEPYLTGECEIR